MPRPLAKQKIEGIRLIATAMWLHRVETEVMAPELTPQQLKDYQLHMKKEFPQAYEAWEELQRQSRQVARKWAKDAPKRLKEAAND